MKPIDDIAVPTALIADALQRAGIAADDAQISLLAWHLTRVMEANKSMNLTAIRSLDAAVMLHVVDSLLALPEIAAAPAGIAIDMGSGAGFPGLPLAMMTRREFVLAESIKKKASFLQSLVDEGRTQSVAVSAFRVEDIALDQPGGFSVVTARALSSLPSLLELAAPLLASGGHLIALKARPEDAEYRSAEVVGRMVGMREAGRRQVDLPDGETRTILVYERSGRPQLRLPRRPGLAQRRPLG